jgi:endonuclease/exonuclease/phosphatase family metal-dependent hydrolase
MPPSARREPVSDTIPAKQPDSIRIVSYNVFKRSPQTTPDPFARIFRALDPDIILIQEWSDADFAILETWFTTHVPVAIDWHAASVPTLGVAIIAKQRIDPIMADYSAGNFAIVHVHTSLAKIAVASVHLQCCGNLDSPQDRKRRKQARAINRAARKVAGGLLVIGGDFNLVGSRSPLDLVRENLDADRSDLEVATMLVHGDSAVYSWRQPADIFPPGQLDFFLYSDAVADLRQAFALNTALLSEEALHQAGLTRDDTAASDHLPIVMDIAPRNED